MKLNIATPAQPIPRGLGFYQTEDDLLYVPIGGIDVSRHFFSYIDSPTTRFDLDKEGRLMFIELSVPKAHWKIVDKLTQPAIIEPADIHWLDFRKSIAEPELFTNEEKTRLLIKLSDETPESNYYLADSVILQVGGSKNACGIFITEIVDDVAGRKIAAFRRELSSKVTPTSGLN